MAETGGVERTYASILFVLYTALNDNALMVFVNKNGYVPVKMSVADYVKGHLAENPLYKIVVGFYNQVLVTNLCLMMQLCRKFGVQIHTSKQYWSEYAKALLQEGLPEDQAVERAVSKVDEQLNAAQAAILEKIRVKDLEVM